MVATVHVFFDFAGADAAPGTEQDTNALGPPNLRFKTADDATIDSANPIPIPTAGTNRSFWKQIYLEVTAGAFTQIDNVQFFTDGTNFGTGITTNIGDQFPVKNSGSNAGYELATGVVGTSGDDVLATMVGHSGITTVSDAFSFTSGSALTITISEAGSIIDAIGDATNYAVIQMDVISTASPGDLVDETWTYQYDEI